MRKVLFLLALSSLGFMACSNEPSPSEVASRTKTVENIVWPALSDCIEAIVYSDIRAEVDAFIHDHAEQISDQPYFIGTVTEPAASLVWENTIATAEDGEAVLSYKSNAKSFTYSRSSFSDSAIVSPGFEYAHTRSEAIGTEQTWPYTANLVCRTEQGSYEYESEVQWLARYSGYVVTALRLKAAFGAKKVSLKAFRKNGEYEVLFCSGSDCETLTMTNLAKFEDAAVKGLELRDGTLEPIGEARFVDLVLSDAMAGVFLY